MEFFSNKLGNEKFGYCNLMKSISNNNSNGNNFGGEKC